MYWFWDTWKEFVNEYRPGFYLHVAPLGKYSVRKTIKTFSIKNYFNAFAIPNEIRHLIRHTFLVNSSQSLQYFHITERYIIFFLFKTDMET